LFKASAASRADMSAIWSSTGRKASARFKASARLRSLCALRPPPPTPFAFAAASAALVRSLIIPASNSATAAMTVRTILPIAPGICGRSQNSGSSPRAWFRKSLTQT
jgi:hypothetical protein